MSELFQRPRHQIPQSQTLSVFGNLPIGEREQKLELLFLSILLKLFSMFKNPFYLIPDGVSLINFSLSVSNSIFISIFVFDVAFFGL